MNDSSIHVRIRDVEMDLFTHPGIFSPKAPDKGTLAMLSQVEFTPQDKVLDLGCGYGLVGILAARLIGPEQVVMVDIDERCVEYAAMNAARNGVPGVKIVRSDGLREIDDTGFSLILCNPPYHVDFNVPKEFVHKGFNRLVLGGRFYMVTKRLPWYRNKLTGIFGGVQVTDIDGYHVFMAVKRSMTYAKVENPHGIKQKMKANARKRMR